MHAFPCTPIIKDAKNYVLQDCLGDLVLFVHDCCDFGLPVPLYILLYNLGVFVKAASPSFFLFCLSPHQ
jgi:hypothetical protein